MRALKPSDFTENREGQILLEMKVYDPSLLARKLVK